MAARVIEGIETQLTVVLEVAEDVLNDCQKWKSKNVFLVN